MKCQLACVLAHLCRMAESRSCLTSCSVCKNILRDPRILHCMDSFCLACIRKACEDKRAGEFAECPACAAPFQIPEHGIDSLKVNEFVMQLLQARNCTSEMNIKCDICSTGDKACASESSDCAVSYCSRCNQYLCEKCIYCHSKMTATKMHLTVPARKAQEMEILMQQGCKACDVHSEESLVLYCHNCSEILCLKCNFEGHRTHKCEYIDDAVTELRKRLDGKVAELTDCLDDYRRQRDDLEKDWSDAKDQIDQVQLLLACKKEELKRCIDNDAAKLLSELQVIRDYVDQEYQIACDRTKYLHEQVAYVKELSSGILTEGTNTLLSSVANDLCRRATEMLEQHKQRQARHLGRPSVEVTFQSLGLDHLSAKKPEGQRVNLIGKIRAWAITTPPPCESSSDRCQPNRSYVKSVAGEMQQLVLSRRPTKPECRSFGQKRSEVSPPLADVNARLSQACSLGLRTLRADCSSSEVCESSAESSDDETFYRCDTDLSSKKDSGIGCGDADDGVVLFCDRARFYIFRRGERTVDSSGQLTLKKSESNVYMLLKHKKVSSPVKMKNVLDENYLSCRFPVRNDTFEFEVFFFPRWLLT